MFASIYKKIVLDFSKVTLLFLIVLIIFSLYQSRNFNLDASSDALLLEGDPDLKYLREVNETYGSKDFLVLTYTPVLSFTERETILNLQLLKSKIEKLTWVDKVITVIDVPLLKSTDEGLMDRLKNYKTLAYPEIDRKRGFDEIINSPIYKNYVISEDGKTSGIVVYLKKDERLAEYIKVKDKYFYQSNEVGLSKEEKINYKQFIKESSFIDDLGADSLDTVELVMAFEEEFGSEISDSEAEKILTVGDAIKFIESKSA